MTLYRFDGYAVDAVLSAGHDAESEVTDFPTESGGAFTDHIQNRPIEATFEVIVTDAPMGEVAALREGLSITASQDAYLTFTSIRDARLPITIEAPLATYDNMALLNLSIPQTVEDGESIRFSVTFKQIEVVKVERSVVTLPRAKGPSRARPRVTAGKATGQSAYLAGRVFRARNRVTGETGYYWAGNVYQPQPPFGIYEAVPESEVAYWVPMDFDQSAHTWVDASTGRPVQELTPVPDGLFDDADFSDGREHRPWWTGGGGS